MSLERAIVLAIFMLGTVSHSPA